MNKFRKNTQLIQNQLLEILLNLLSRNHTFVADFFLYSNLLNFFKFPNDG